ncbi:MAG TPA: TolC family protein [Fibrobacteria bacterium]|nr:TolC family protein [Fibrobacteria bacterium]
MHPSRATPYPSVFFAAAALLAAPGHALSLHDAQEILFKDNPDLTVMRLEVERSESQLQEAKAAWLPSLDAIGNYTYTSEVSHLTLNLPIPPPNGTQMDRPIGDHDKAELGLDAGYALFTGFSRGKNVEAKRAGVQAREAQWRAARNQMSMRLAALYYAWQSAGTQAAYQEKALEHARELQKQLQDFVRAGTAVRSRALAAEAKAKASEVELLSYQNMRDSLAYEVLDFLGGGDSSGTVSPDMLTRDTAALPEPAWDTADAASPRRPETEAIDRSMAQARYGSQALSGQKLPQLFGMAGVRYANPGLDLDGDEFMPYGVLGLQLKWNLFDGAKNRSQRKQLEVQGRILKEQQRKLGNDWRKAMLTSRLQYSRWSAQFEAAKASRAAAAASAADLKRQFEAGVATGLDWLEATNNQAWAEMMMEQARTMQRLALLQWQYASGKELRF